jgi:glycosyltransferase
MMAGPKISVILPSFRDPRILDAIASVRAFDDIETCRIIVIDGGSAQDLVTQIAATLTPLDTLVSEKDQGIFDALNKGLDRVQTPYVGWIGSDDLYTGSVRASDVVGQLETSDLFIAPLFIVRGSRIVRKTHAWPSAHGLASLGLHNPHYSTFGRFSLLGAERFEVGDVSADIDYFLRIFKHKPRVSSTNKVALLQAEGGFSNSSLRKTLSVNRHAYQAYSRRTNSLTAIASIAIKLSYKIFGVGYYKLRRSYWHDLFPDLHAIIDNRQHVES